MRNKILKLLLMLFILTTLLPLPRFTTVATESETENLVRNGDFEVFEAMKNTWDNAFVVPYEYDKEKDGVIEGMIERATDLPEDRPGYALKFTTSKSNLGIHCQQRFFYPSAPQNSDLSDFVKKSNAFKPGATYELSFEFYIHKLDDDYDNENIENMGLHYTFSPDRYDIEAKGATSGWVAYKEKSTTTNGRWINVSDTVQAPTDAKQLRIIVQSSAKGIVYFDDITLVEVGEPEKFEYTTSHMFHYADENEVGEASVSITPFYEGTGLDKTHSVSFDVYDGNTWVAGQDKVNFSNNKAVFTYSPDAVLKEKKTKYTLSVSVKDSSDEVVDVFSQSLYRYERPKFLDKDGNFRGEDGEVIDPFIAWGARYYDMEEAARAGFTMCVLPFDCARFENKEGREEFMKDAKEAGLYVIGSLCYGMKAAADDANLENTVKMVTEYMNEERFVGWIVQDEPLGGNPKDKEYVKELLEESYTTIRNIDPNHPVILLDYNSGVKVTSKYCDIFMPNAYGRSHKEVRYEVEEAVKYANGRPIWPNVAAYANGDGTQEELPKGEQVQHFIYQAFLAGAKGVSVYDFQYPVPSNKNIQLIETPIWESLVDTGSTEVPVLFDLFVHGNAPKVDDESDYVQRKWTRDDGEYYVLLSASDNGATVEYDIGKDKSVKILGGDDISDYTLENGKLSVKLKKNNNIVQNGKEKCFDVQIFKVYDTVKEPQVTWGGIKYVAPYLPPAGVQTFFIAAYKEKDGIAQLQEVKRCERPRIAQEFVSEGEAQDYTIKVFAFDTSLKPLADVAVIPPVPNPTAYEG